MRLEGGDLSSEITFMNEEERKQALRMRTKRFAGGIVRLFVRLDRRR